MARRVFLHIGTAKSGTTYLQELWWRHHQVLRERGLLLPGRRRDHFHAAALVKGMDEVVDRFSPAQTATWSRLMDEIRGWPGDALLSNEHFSDTPAPAAASALADLHQVAAEVHLVVTVRDLGRVLPSSWQQRVKQGARQPYGVFLDSVRQAQQENKFWRYQDVPAILDRWSAGIDPGRVHLVTVPPAGAARDQLWLRAASVLGVEVADLDSEPPRTNESLSIVEAELLRLINVEIPREARDLELNRAMKKSFAGSVLAGSSEPEPFALPASHVEWVRRHAVETVEALEARGYDVVGDLGELLPGEVRQGRSPEDAQDQELLAAATGVIARLLLDQRGTKAQ